MSLFDSKKLKKEQIENRVSQLEAKIEDLSAPMRSLLVSGLEVTDGGITIDEEGVKVSGTLMMDEEGIKMLADAVVTTASIADLAVDVNKLAELAVEASKLANSSVTATKIANLAVGAAAIANLAVGTAHIANAAITDAKIANLSANKVTAGELIGRTVKAVNGTGVDVWVQNNGQILFRYGGSTKGYMYCTTSGTVYLRAYDNMYIVGDDDLTMGSNGNILLWGDDITIGYDDDDNGSDLYFVANNAGQVTGKLTTGGDLNIHGTLSENQYDFAEYFENKTKRIIKGGKSVVMDGGKVRPAKKGEVPFGVVSLTPAFIGNDGTVDAGEAWGGKYLRDEDMQYVMKKVTKVRYKIKMDEFSKKADKKVICYKGDPIPEDAKYVKEYKKIEKVLNPKYDEKKKFKSRKERPSEWSIVGLVGQALILKDQPVNPNWIFMKKENKKYNRYLIK